MEPEPSELSIAKNSQSRKFQVTINNPKDKQLGHEEIKRALSSLKGCVYYCMADEIGLENQTPHTHIFLALKTPIRFSTVKRLFPSAHIEPCRGTPAENRDYVGKTSKWKSDPKGDTTVEGTFEEWGEMPQEVGQGYRSDIVQVYQQIEEGLTNAQIMALNPDTAQYIGKMDKIRQDILADIYRDTFRELEVTYIFGPTKTGKTRSVMEKHGYREVYRTTDRKYPFDFYQSEPVLLLEEFRDSFPISEILNYLDGYPLLLPARYSNRVACYSKVYIISNKNLRQQYIGVQETDPDTWEAFLRRIHHVIEFQKGNPPIDHGTALDYIFPPPPPEWTQVSFEEMEGQDIPF